MFYEMCGMETDNKTHHTQELCAIKPLGDSLPFEVINKAEIWHPVWDAQVDHTVNAKFLAAVVEHIMTNEMVIQRDVYENTLTCHLVEASWSQ